MESLVRCVLRELMFFGEKLLRGRLTGVLSSSTMWMLLLNRLLFPRALLAWSIVYMLLLFGDYCILRVRFMLN